MLLDFVEAPYLEALEDLSVCSLRLAVAARVSYRDVANLHAKVGAVGLEEAAGELRAIVGDDVVGDAEEAHQTLDELHRRSHRDVADWLHLRPLGEFVDGDVEVAVVPDSAWEWSRDVQPLDRK